jgi:adenosylhomocysteine nucleosidase
MELHAQLALLLSAAAACAQSTPAPIPRYDPTPRLGILIPKGPPDYALLLVALQYLAPVHDGPLLQPEAPRELAIIHP